MTKPYLSMFRGFGEAGEQVWYTALTESRFCVINSLVYRWSHERKQLTGLVKWEPGETPGQCRYRYSRVLSLYTGTQTFPSQRRVPKGRIAGSPFVCRESGFFIIHFFTKGRKEKI